MPYSIKKSGSGYTVRSPHGTKAKNTSRAKAEAQVRLLQGIEHNPKFAKAVRRRAKTHR